MIGVEERERERERDREARKPIMLHHIPFADPGAATEASEEQFKYLCSAFPRSRFTCQRVCCKAAGLGSAHSRILAPALLKKRTNKVLENAFFHFCKGSNSLLGPPRHHRRHLIWK